MRYINLRLTYLLTEIELPDSGGVMLLLIVYPCSV